eukprot:2354681-Amphidinium_carterae.1
MSVSSKGNKARPLSTCGQLEYQVKHRGIARLDGPMNSGLKYMRMPLSDGNHHDAVEDHIGTLNPQMS